MFRDNDRAEDRQRTLNIYKINTVKILLQFSPDMTVHILHKCDRVNKLLLTYTQKGDHLFGDTFHFAD